MGTTLFLAQWHRILSVHPHARGDNAVAGSCVPPVAGSPPRPWGQRNRNAKALHVKRFTPTPVGTTAPSGACASGIAVHPHARGDNAVEAAPVVRQSGSPPRPWGQRLTRCDRLHHDGSPPRPWGQRACQPSRWWCHRFTHTPVGTTSTDVGQNARQAVHPHARGDNTSITSCPAARRGSPPRPWGQPRGCCYEGPQGRFTPTPVGTTDRLPPVKRQKTVHPHARGDNFVTRQSDGTLLGSPPRPWGQP